MSGLADRIEQAHGRNGFRSPAACAVCGKHITWTFMLCMECIDEYGYYASDWPEWVRYLTRQKKVERRRIDNQRERESDYDDTRLNKPSV